MVGTFDPENPTDLFVYTLVIKGLQAFSEHTLVRTKVVMFGEDLSNLDTYTHDATRIATGMFNSMPLASLHWVDSVWHLPYIVQPTENGPRLVRTESERREVLIAAGQDPGTEPGWEILKNQLALKHNLANTGRGMALTNAGGDNSPYSSGTSIFMGWALSSQLGSGEWVWDELDNWGVFNAAAWTGWCGMKPGDECQNTFIHEIGHSQTMFHFSDGTAEQWGIADEYPNDGQNIASHPWGYDTTSRRFRTWYNHDRDNGKFDPMNGGEISNDETCFPQYTAYQAQKSLNWATASPILLSSKISDVTDGDGAYIFNTSNHKYEKVSDFNIGSAVDSTAMPPLEVGIPVVTLIGTLGADLQACQTYSALRAAKGNTFVLPHPFDSTLSSNHFTDAAYFVRVNYEDGSIEDGLIGVQDLGSSKDIGYYAFTIAMSKRPISVSLYSYVSDSWPNLSESSSYTLLHKRTITLPENAMDGVEKAISVGRGFLGKSQDLKIKSICLSDAQCLKKGEAITWRGNEGSEIVYTSNFPNNVSGNATIFQVSLVRLEDTSIHEVQILASRYVEEGGDLYSLIDSSFLSLSSPPDATHGILVYVPYSLNENLPGGGYVLKGDPIEILASKDGLEFTSFTLDVSLNILDATDLVSLNLGFLSDDFFPLSVYPTASSAYFLATDSDVGPTSSVWWGGSRETLFIPLYSSCLGGFVEEAKVVASVKAQQESCGSTWQMNAGRLATDACGHALRLTIDSEIENPWLLDGSLQGCTFSSHPMKPIVINARRWHDPLGTALIGTLLLDFDFSL